MTHRKTLQNHHIESQAPRAAFNGRLAAGVALALALGTPALSSADDRLDARSGAAATAHIQAQMLPSPLTSTVGRNALFRGQAPADGTVRVSVRLEGEPVASYFDSSRAGRIARREELRAQQAAFMSQVQAAAPGARQVAATQLVLNAVFLEVDAAQVETLAAITGVSSVKQVVDYPLDLDETVPYIGGTAVQAQGFDGSGVRVAVLDSGIDYTHANLGGAGTLEAYEAAWGTSPADPKNTTLDGLFPTFKVVGGFDFVGEDWPNSPEAPDPDPIDLEGHGTHVADIIAGLGGVAPGADLYAVKTCSAVASSCSGIGLIQGVEFAVDPNGDGDPEDAVDIMNMSLGSPYGNPFDDDLAAAVENAAAYGVFTVASSGNSADKPYITGTPAGAPSALSVAQTEVPSAALPFVNVSGIDFPAVFQNFSVLPEGVAGGPLQYGDGAGGNLNGCDAFAPDSLDGLTVLVDRGACAFSQKIANIGNAGGLVGIIGLIAPGDPFAGSSAGDLVTIPGYMVNQINSDIMKTLTGALATVDPESSLPLAGTMVGSSSRGPSLVYNQIKPEIGAPGASISAVAGSGVGEEPFGGTSGAAPMVSGAAALLMEAYPGLPFQQIKALLVNTGETEVFTDAFSGLAPITRIGGGEVRVDRALASSVAAYETDTMQPALSLGFMDIDRESYKIRKRITLMNYSNNRMEYNVSASFRYADDAASNAISFDLPNRVRVRGGRSASFDVDVHINGQNLPNNPLDSGFDGANPIALTGLEYDGYLHFTPRNGGPGAQTIHMPWHIIPRKAAAIQTKGVGKSTVGPDAEPRRDDFLRFRRGVAELDIRNEGVGTAQLDAYALLAYNNDQPEGGFGQQSPVPDLRAFGVSTVPVPFCASGFLLRFAINTWERQQHLLPVVHIVALDINQDGVDDYEVFNIDQSWFGDGSLISDGRQLAVVADLNAGGSGAFFYAEHATNTGNTVLTVCGEQVGLSVEDILSTNIDVDVITLDFYFGGPGDFTDGITFTPLGERYVPTNLADVPPGGRLTVDVQDFGQFPGSSDDMGVLLFTNGDRGAGNHGGANEHSEALIIPARD